MGDRCRSRDVSSNPQHDRRHVADGRPSSSAIGGDHDDTAENPTFLIVADQFPDQHDHHDRSRQVIQDGGHEEGDRSDDEQQLPLVVRGDAVGYEHEPSVRIDQFHGDHRSDQEYQSLSDLSDTVQYLMVDDETGALVRVGQFLYERE